MITSIRLLALRIRDDIICEKAARVVRGLETQHHAAIAIRWLELARGQVTFISRPLIEHYIATARRFYLERILTSEH